MGPTCLARVSFAPHMLDQAWRDLSYDILRDWVVAVLGRYRHHKRNFARSRGRDELRLSGHQLSTPTSLTTEPPAALDTPEVTEAAEANGEAGVACTMVEAGLAGQSTPRINDDGFRYKGFLKLGRKMNLRTGERAGKESWRQKPSKKRLTKIKCSASHPLAGLVGYSE